MAVLKATYSKDLHLMHLYQEMFCHLFSLRSHRQTPSNSTTGCLDISGHNMDLQKLDQAVQGYFRAGLAPSSHKTYLSAERWYLESCKGFKLDPLPTSEQILCYFAACLGQQGLAHSTIKTYPSGVRQLQIAHGGTDPGIDKMPRLQVFRGVKAECGKQGKPCSCLPGILRKIKMSWTGKDSSFESVVLWAAALTMFFSFCRSGEIMVENEHRYDPTRHLSWQLTMPCPHQ